MIIRSKAFTLIELLVSISLISMMCVALFYFMYSSIGLMSRSMNNERSLQLVRSVTSRISLDIKQSGGISNGSGPNKLIIGQICYEFKNGKIMRTEGNDSYYMTIEGEIKGLEFNYPSSKLVKMALTTATGGQYYLSVYSRN
jgi:prepilin-type N-terminal cleavage/methylation domain-containing protein